MVRRGVPPALPAPRRRRGRAGGDAHPPARGPSSRAGGCWTWPAGPGATPAPSTRPAPAASASICRSRLLRLARQVTECATGAGRHAPAADSARLAWTSPSISSPASAISTGTRSTPPRSGRWSRTVRPGGWFVIDFLNAAAVRRPAGAGRDPGRWQAPRSGSPGRCRPTAATSARPSDAAEGRQFQRAGAAVRAGRRWRRCWQRPASTVRHRFGDYDASPLGPGSPRTILAGPGRMTLRDSYRRRCASDRSSSPAPREGHSIPPLADAFVRQPGPGCGAGATARAGRARRHHRAAAGSLHRPALHRAQGALHRRARPGARATVAAAGGAGLLDRRRRSRLRRGQRGLLDHGGWDRRPGVAPAAARRRPAHADVPPAAGRRRGAAALDTLAADLPPSEFRDETLAVAARATIGRRPRSPAAFARRAGRAARAAGDRRSRQHPSGVEACRRPHLVRALGLARELDAICEQQAEELRLAGADPGRAVLATAPRW